MALTWAGVITILFLAAACVRGYRRGLIKELVSLVCVFLSMAIVWFINPYVNEFIRENTSIYEKVQESCQDISVLPCCSLHTSGNCCTSEYFHRLI